MSLVESLEKSLALASSDPRVWIKNELAGLLRRVRVNGGNGAGSGASKALKNSEPSKALAYPSHDPNHSLINPKKKVRELAASQVEAISEVVNEGMFAELRSMSDEDLKQHFGKIDGIKEFIKSHGGTISVRANWEQTIDVFRSLVGEVVSGDEEE